MSSITDRLIPRSGSNSNIVGSLIFRPLEAPSSKFSHEGAGKCDVYNIKLRRKITHLSIR